MAGELRLLKESLMFLTEKKSLIKKYVDTGKYTQEGYDLFLKHLQWCKPITIKEGVWQTYVKVYEDWLLHEIHRHLKWINKDSTDIKELTFFLSTSMSMLVKLSLKHYSLMTKGIEKKTLPYYNSNTDIDWDEYIKDIHAKYASKKSETDLGGTYKKVYDENGFEIFACINQEAVQVIGASANWCVRRDSSYWNDYNTNGQRFYVIIDHYRSKTNDEGIEDNFRKVCIQWEKHDITIWDYNDNNMKLDKYINEIKKVVSSTVAEKLKNAIKNLDGFDSEYDDEDEKLSEELQGEWDFLHNEMNRWIDETKELQNEFNEDLEKSFNELGNMLKTGKYKNVDENKLEDLKYEWEKAEGDFENMYNFLHSLEYGFTKGSSKYYYDELTNYADMSWFPEAAPILIEWWRDNGINPTEVKTQISYFCMEESNTLDLPNPYGN